MNPYARLAIAILGPILQHAAASVYNRHIAERYGLPPMPMPTVAVLPALGG